MRDALRYERIRLSTTHGFYVLSAATVIVSALLSWAMSQMIANIAPDMTAEASRGAATLAATRSPLLLLAPGLLGAFSFGQEKRYGMLCLALLAVPRRSTLFAAKAVTTVVATILLTIVSLLTSLVISNGALGSQYVYECEPHVVIGCLVLANGWALLGIAAGLLLPRTGAVALLAAGSALIEPLLGQLVEKIELWGTSAAAFLPFRAGASLISIENPSLTAVVSETSRGLPALAGGGLFFLYVAVLLWLAYRRGLLNAR